MTEKMTIEQFDTEINVGIKGSNESRCNII